MDAVPDGAGGLAGGQRGGTDPVAAIWRGTNRMLMATALAWSMPVALLLVYGQDTPFWLLWVALGLLLLERGNPRLAGVVFACMEYHRRLSTSPAMTKVRRRKIT